MQHIAFGARSSTQLSPYLLGSAQHHPTPAAFCPRDIFQINPRTECRDTPSYIYSNYLSPKSWSFAFSLPIPWHQFQRHHENANKKKQDHLSNPAASYSCPAQSSHPQRTEWSKANWLNKNACTSISLPPRPPKQKHLPSPRSPRRLRPASPRAALVFLSSRH